MKNILKGRGKDMFIAQKFLLVLTKDFPFLNERTNWILPKEFLVAHLNVLKPLIQQSFNFDIALDERFNGRVTRFIGMDLTLFSEERSKCLFQSCKKKNRSTNISFVRSSFTRVKINRQMPFVDQPIGVLADRRSSRRNLEENRVIRVGERHFLSHVEVEMRNAVVRPLSFDIDDSSTEHRRHL